MPPRASLKFRAIAFASRFMVAPVAVVGPAKARADLLKASPGPAVLFGNRPPLARVSDETLAGGPIRRYLPHNARPGTVAFFHGGGWMLGLSQARQTVAHGADWLATHLSP